MLNPGLPRWQEQRYHPAPTDAGPEQSTADEPIAMSIPAMDAPDEGEEPRSRTRCGRLWNDWRDLVGRHYTAMAATIALPGLVMLVSGIGVAIAGGESRTVGALAGSGAALIVLASLMVHFIRGGPALVSHGTYGG